MSENLLVSDVFIFDVDVMIERLMGPSWDLSAVYQGTDDPLLETDLALLERYLRELSDLNGRFLDHDALVAQQLFLQLELAEQLLSNLETYANCRLSVDSGDEAAQYLFGSLQRFQKQVRTFSKPLHHFEAHVDLKILEAYLADVNVTKARFSIEHRRALAGQLLTQSEEQLVEGLAQDGIHAWGNLYTQLSGSLECEVLVGNKTQTMGVAQSASLMMDPSDTQRKNAWLSLNQAWEAHQESCSASLNAISGWRLELCAQRGSDVPVGFMDSAAHMNKISLETLSSLLSSAKKGRPMAQRAAKLQARTMGKERLGPWDLRAPAPRLTGESSKLIPFDMAIEIITEAYSAIDSEMGDFVSMMVEEDWIEGTVGPKKRPGAYCTSFSKSLTPRVYMSYAGRESDVITLAHELGHALHFWLMRDLPESQRRYGMSLAETASTLGETAVRNALLDRASNNEERLSIMWEELSAFTTFLLNIPTRFEFEKNFYEKRAERPLRPEEIKRMMGDAWIEWYGDSLSEPDSMFWASKLHFYISGLSFYNFPYLFGYLFSLGVYEQKDNLGESFYPKYVALLRDTGRMGAEDLAEKHLGSDIRRPEFWDRIIGAMAPRIDEYEELLGSLTKA